MQILVGNGVVLTAATFFLNYAANQRSVFGEVMREVGEIGKGDVLNARHTVGVVLEEDEKLTVDDLSGEQLKAFFTVLWAFDRVYALHQSVRSPTRRPRSRAQKLLLRAVKPSVQTWKRYIDRAPESARIASSRTALIKLHEEVSKLKK